MEGESQMKKAVLVMLVVAFIGFSVEAAWAGPAEETLRQWAEQMQAQGPEFFPEGIIPQVNMGYYYDLLSNAPGWASFLVVTNWSLNTRIQFNTAFVPTTGTPANITQRTHFIDPNEVAYLDQYALGFNSFGTTNWFGIGVALSPPSWVSSGILLYSADFGLTWVPADGPYSF
jgi:hypothetical protein